MKIIAKQGCKHLLIFGFLFLLSVVLDLFWCVFLALFVATIFIFRNPKRTLGSDDEYAILSPIDGKIKSIKRISYFEKDCIEVVISNSILEAGVLRSPCDLKLAEFKRRRGLFLCSAIKSANSLNERVLYICKHGDNKLAIRIIAGAMSRNLRANKFEDLKAGEEFGFIADGNVMLILPADTRISAAIGDRVKATFGVIGFFNYKGRK